MNKKKDQIFASQQKRIQPFEFNQKVAEVFDDMVSRSVPFYQEVHRLCADMVLRFYQGQGSIIDLGCSTGTTIILLDQELKEKSVEAKFIGVDNSPSMLEIAKKKCSHIKNLKLQCEDMCEVDFSDSEVVILNYTLQFLAPEKRLKLLTKIYTGLRPGGIILLSEKICTSSSSMQELITDLYYDFKKRNGYNQLEISQKREALENVLIPLTSKEQLSMMEHAGFKGPEMLFRWYNFASYLGQKE